MPDLATRLADLISDGATRLRKAGLPEARREAIRIWCGVTDDQPENVVLHPEGFVDASRAASYERALERRSAGQPLAHVTGKTGFRKLELMCDARALIPRPETEGLVDLLLQRVRTGRVVDVGTGSGCIALSLVQEGNFREVVAVERSVSALALARLNSRFTGFEPRFLLGDMCQPFSPGAFDALISNPPYLTEAEYRDLDASVQRWEPEMALVSGITGMTATTRLLDQARDVLAPDGWLALELDCSRATDSAAQAVTFGWRDVSVHMDLFGRERYLLARRSNTR